MNTKTFFPIYYHTLYEVEAKLVPIVEGDLKAPFLLATAVRWR